MTKICSKNSLCLWILLSAILVFPSLLSAQTVPLLSQPQLDPYGLKRVWFHQLKLHPSLGKVRSVVLEGEQLFVTTSDATLHAFDSETGVWLWSRSVGRREILLTEPAVNSRIVAIHNNLVVYLFNRKTGKQLLQIPLPEAASAACEMSEHYIYIPMVNQTFLVYALKEPITPQSPDDIPEISIRRMETNNDPELAKIVQQFEEAKRLLRPAESEEKDADTFVLDSTHRVPITCPTMGTLRTQPLLLSQFYSWVLDEAEQPTHEIAVRTHREFLAWVTEQGYLYAAGIAQFSDQNMSPIYRIDSAGQVFYMDRTQTIQIDRPGNKALLARPTQSQVYPVNELNPDKIILPDIVVTGGRAAYVFAIDARTGAIRWQYPTLGQLLEPIAVIGKDVYAPTANGVLHAIDLMTGKERWSARNVRRFVAASQQRIYVLDQRNRLVCLDRATGASVFMFDIRQFEHCLFNLETDQIFLVTDSGLVQCLRERQFDSDADTNVSLRHRITSAEFTTIVRGAETPKLWWVEELEAEEP